MVDGMNEMKSDANSMMLDVNDMRDDMNEIRDDMGIKLRQKEYLVSLISTREFVENLHFGSYARDCWLACPNNDNTTNTSFSNLY
ncbi:6789_t:CDS:2 [Rhizophagus irregularis]|nr:6789_t:CDS:2 [Rhizophagus irregularis]